MKEVTKFGKTVEEAIAEALRELKTTKDQVKIDVVEEPKKGFLGLGSKPAVVTVKVDKDPVESARTFLEEVTLKMGVPVAIKEIRDDRDVIFQLSGEKIAILIGKRGSTLNALQYLTNVTANRHSDEHVHFIVDAENYRSRRRETLERLAQRNGQRVRETGREVALDPMPSMERKIVHLALKNEEGIQTYSDGSEPNRRVIIAPE
ncbi:MAG TPA: RNA-binding cell elongation regulator Jag/EloR [Bacillales bacterium]|nr:RNA-binding cell elongation regulator Jag/EloR [Bacillales bacterium]